jgi:2-polyprenyl-6-methoxyphenol hydroxylase-like FAD-dependent oxidoreductase
MDADVVIAGAGPTGLMLAAELLRHGAKPLIVDRDPAPSPLSRAIVVHARTLEVLEAHGLAEPLVERGVRLERVRMWSGGKVLVDVPFGGLPTRWPFLLSVPQSVTEELLADRVRALGGAIARGVELRSFRQDADGVDVVLSDRTVRTAWLVGCDGAHSTVRHGLGLAFDGHAYEQRLAPSRTAAGASSPPAARSRTTARTRPCRRCRRWSTSAPTSAGGSPTRSGWPGSASTPARSAATASGACCWPGTPPTSTAPSAARG